MRPSDLTIAARRLYLARPLRLGDDNREPLERLGGYGPADVKVYR
jgi:hypothetical protein